MTQIDLTGRTALVTGGAQGLGEGIALALIDKEHHLICIGRSESHRLRSMCAASECALDFLPCDLADTHAISILFDTISQIVDTTKAKGIYLINNAGVLEPVGRVETSEPHEVELHLRINLLAPMLLSAGFIKAFSSIPLRKRILNISSGAAQSPYYGWSSYCTGKAGLDMHSRCIHEEQRYQTHPVEVMAVAPGIIDTRMQALIRSTSEEQFIHKQKFVELKEQGHLVPPTLAGKRLADLLIADNFESGSVVDLRDT